MEKLDDLKQSARRALASLNVLVGRPDADDIVEDAAIQRFEYTIEVMWKTTQRLLFEQGTVVASPKPTIRHAHTHGILSEDDAERALKLIDLRNLTTHTYKEELARSIYPMLPEISALFERWLTGIESFQGEPSP